MPRRSEDTAVTADHVAELAGVSRWTVNRAFKKNASISQKTRTKVMAAAEELGYAPDLLAASLASDQSNLVSVLIDDFANPHKLVMMERLTRVLRKNGWDTLLVNTLDEDDALSALMQASQRRVDAAIMIGSGFNDIGIATALAARRVRKLIVFSRMSLDPNTISICCDDVVAMRELTEHLVNRGYKRPLFVAGPNTQSAHVLRKETFLQKWQEATRQRPKVLPLGVYDPAAARKGVTEFLDTTAPVDLPDILVCENDAIAMGAIDAIRHNTMLRIPGDIAVTGFDDVPQAESPLYNLTTYRPPLTEMANGLVDVLKGEADTAKLRKFTGRLVIRNSA